MTIIKSRLSKPPDCSQCMHKSNIPGDAHISCTNHKAKVKGNLHGIMSGWFNWPWNFDPTWLMSCNGFLKK